MELDDLIGLLLALGVGVYLLCTLFQHGKI